jgi:hypothetical protein
MLYLIIEIIVTVENVNIDVIKSHLRDFYSTDNNLYYRYKKVVQN